MTFTTKRAKATNQSQKCAAHDAGNGCGTPLTLQISYQTGGLCLLSLLDLP